MEAYLDNSATTRCSESVRDIMLQVMMEDYGNPSSLHLMGKKAEDYIKEAREKIVELMGDLPRVELFAREKTEGWDAWGNEVESDIEISSDTEKEWR